MCGAEVERAVVVELPGDRVHADGPGEEYHQHPELVVTGGTAQDAAEKRGHSH